MSESARLLNLAAMEKIIKCAEKVRQELKHFDGRPEFEDAREACAGLLTLLLKCASNVNEPEPKLKPEPEVQVEPESELASTPATAPSAPRPLHPTRTRGRPKKIPKQEDETVQNNDDRPKRLTKRVPSKYVESVIGVPKRKRTPSASPCKDSQVDAISKQNIELKLEPRKAIETASANTENDDGSDTKKRRTKRKKTLSSSPGVKAHLNILKEDNKVAVKPESKAEVVNASPKAKLKTTKPLRNPIGKKNADIAIKDKDMENVLDTSSKAPKVPQNKTVLNDNKDKVTDMAKKSKSPKRKELNVSIKRLSTSKLQDSFSTSFSRTTKDGVDKRNSKGETRLHAACSTRKYSDVQELLGTEVNVNTKDHAGWTPLHEVVSCNAVEIVKLLLEKGALPDVPGPMNETPLHEAVRNNYMEIIQLLVEYGANVNLRNSGGKSPVDLANDNIKSLLRKCNTGKHPSNNFSLDSLCSTTTNNSVIKIYISPKQDKNVIKKLELLTKHHKHVSIVGTLNSDTNLFLINNSGDVVPTNLDTLTSVLLGVPVISFDWIMASNEHDLADLKIFELTTLGYPRECIRLSYMNRLKMFPKLFNGCHFYFLDLNKEYEINTSLKVNKQILTKLVVDGGGVVLKREPDPESIPVGEKVLPFHTVENGVLENCPHFIIYRMRPPLAYNMKHLKSLPVGWLIECIQRFQLIDP